MATPAWLPPLNSHPYSVTHVRVRELELTERRHVEPKLKFAASVDVVFYSQTDVSMKREVRGLSLWKSELIDAATPETLAASLRENVIDDEEFIPFPIDSCLWTVEDDDSYWTPPLRLCGGRDELLRMISGFVVGGSKNKERKMEAVRLQIRKTVRVPAEEFASWICWLEEQKRVHFTFEMDYARAISEPREAAAVYEEAVEVERRRPVSRAFVKVMGGSGGDFGEEGCCMICLEECGGGGVAMLPCGHRFHEMCIVRWFKGNHVCPLCRYQMPVDDDDHQQ